MDGPVAAAPPAPANGEPALKQVPAACEKGLKDRPEVVDGPVDEARVLSACDIVAGLDEVEENLGDVRWATRILRSWAAAGRPTPGGQLVSADAVAKALDLRKLKAHGPGGLLCGRPWPATPLAKRAQELAATNKRQRTLSYDEKAQTRLEQEHRMSELAKGRLQEVLEEIGVHMEEILGRVGPAAVERWRAAPEGCDQRELYTRLVHAVQEPEVSVPQELCAELLPHQIEGLEWLASLYANDLHGILADEMGLGKTIQTITLLLYLQERKGNVGPHLIVAPKSTLSNWEAEFGRFAPGYGVRVLTGDPEEREAELQALRSDIAQGRPTACITNYEQVRRNDFLGKNQWQVVVVDEGHRLKNPETVLHNAMAQMKCRMRLLLTGTPLQNKVGELWALLHYLLPDLFTCMMDFRAWFSRPFTGIPGLNEFEIQLDPEQEQQVVSKMHALLSPFLLQRLKSEVLGDRLPPRVEATVRVPLSAWQSAAYRDLERRTIRLMDNNGSISSEQVQNALMQLRKITLHPYLFEDGFERDERLVRASGKLEALDRLLPKLLRFGHKVLIFSQFTSVLDILEAYLQWRGHPSVRLDGQVSHELRTERIKRFTSDPSLSIFLLSARAGGLGLNLQAADTVVLFDLDWNPQNDKQAIARVHRVGQTKEVRVVRLVTDSAVERHIERRCQEKLDLEKKVMGAGMFRRQATADQRRQALQAVLGLAPAAEGGAPAAPGGAAGTGDLTPLEELNRLLARGEEELAAFSTMDEELLEAGAEAPPRGGEPEGVAERLARCGRLMRAEEVPRGFSGLRDSGE